MNQLREAAESNTRWKPTWFVTKTFRYGTAIELARAKYLRWIKEVVGETGAHICPITTIHRDTKGRVHIHSCLCLDRKINYRSVHNTWRFGFSWDKRYKHGKGGINYILTDHCYIPLEKPFCPRTCKCRTKKGCKALQSDEWKSLMVGAIGLPSSPFVAATRKTNKQTQSAHSEVKPHVITNTNRSSPVRIRRQGKEVI